jgi:ABC-type polysaccharide/polyol phosphate export permease
MVVAASAGAMRFPWTVALLPLALVPWLVAVSGLVLAVSALAVHFRDLKDLLHNVLNLWFFLTPIIYTPDLIPAGLLRQAVLANPVTPLVTLYRDLALHGRLPAASTWGWALLVALVCWSFGSWLFARLREGLAEAV